MKRFSTFLLEEEQKGYIAFDLDGTLAKYDGWKGLSHIGEPVPAMVRKVKEWQNKGYECIIFTARATDSKAIPYIKQWIKDNDLGITIITAKKLKNIIKFYDDRAVHVEPNTGKVS